MDYYMNKAYWDNVTVLAGMSSDDGISCLSYWCFLILSMYEKYAIYYQLSFSI